MKKLILTAVLLTSTLASVNAFANETEITFSAENLEALNQSMETESMDKNYGTWECEAQAVDGAGGIGTGRARGQAARMAMNYCRNYSVQPYSCRVVYCDRF